MEKYNTRSDVPDKYKWDLSSFFKNEEDFNDTYEKAVKLNKEVNNYKGKIKDSKCLYEFL